MIGFFLAVVLIIAVIFLFLRSPVFGNLSTGERLERVKRSPNYKKDQFHNRSFTPNFKEGTSVVNVFKDFFFHRSPRNKPAAVLPSNKTDLLQLDPSKDVLIWFGHSSYFLQIDGKRFLVDPVLSGNAAPVRFMTKSFAGSDVYEADEIPPVDYLLLTHDHYDHMDYRTITRLKNKIGKIITGLGSGAHFERWGFDKNNITEMDWNQTHVLEEGFVISAATARHFSGRTFKRNSSLWLSFILQTPTMKLYLGGDSGYGEHFKVIGSAYGPFDLAILECGQYNEYWKYIHMMPEEVVQAGIDLQARKVLPVHWAKFALSLHAWDDPIKRVTAEAKRRNVPVATPMIGEALPLKEDKTFSSWWEAVA